MYKIYLISSFLVGLCILTSCSTKRIIQDGNLSNVKLKKRSTNYLYKKLTANELDAEWLSMRAKIKFKDPTQTRNFTANIRLRKDSVIWMNVKKLNVEAFRILVRTDSIFIINRLEKEYYVRGLDYVEEQFNFPGQFQALQTAILGNPYFFEKQKLSASISNPQYQLTSGDETRMRITYLLNGLSYILEKMSFFDLERDRKLNVSLDDYRQVNDAFNFAYQRSFLIESEETGEAKINMNFSKVEVNVPKTIRFQISSRYKRVEEIRD